MNPRKKIILSLCVMIAFGGVVLWMYQFVRQESSVEAQTTEETSSLTGNDIEVVQEVDKEAYDAIMRRLARVADPVPEETIESSTQGKEPALWPVNAAYPNVGALLPFHRIVAYYGNFYSSKMGVLGQYSREVVIEKLKSEVRKWEEADPQTPVMPAIDYIAVVAQAGPGEDGGYRLRMPDEHIEKALSMAEELQGIVVLEVQPGRADLQTEIEALEPYLILPQVHLAIDPEFVMQGTNSRPGVIVGHVEAENVNAAAEYLAELVRTHHLPPKVLVVHRYTESMVRDAEKIVPLPEVQIVMDMDGWGPPSQKFNTYNSFIFPYPVQFTGFKLFYKNDVKQPGSHLLTPLEVLSLTPQPSYIQYQ